jgi:hypothetical protein
MPELSMAALLDDDLADAEDVRMWVLLCCVGCVLFPRCCLLCLPFSTPLPI